MKKQRTRTGGMQKGFTYDKELTKRWITNGVEETQLWFKDVANIPEGWYFGRLKRNQPAWNHGLTMSEETRNKCSENARGRQWFNNGTKEILIREEQDIPEGYYKGRLPTSEDTKNKLSNLNSGSSNPNYNKKWSEEQRERAKQRAKENPVRWTDIQKQKQSERLKGKNTWSKGRKRSSEATQKWLEKMRSKTTEDKLQWKLKEYDTKRKNNSFNSSKSEDIFYLTLCEKYKEEDIIRQYRDDRYPFNCDFYIKSLDKFIELNLHWTHGEHPFNKDSEEDIKQKLFLESKASESAYYANALYVWTDLDVRKQKIAKEHNLNYEAIYEL